MLFVSYACGLAVYTFKVPHCAIIPAPSTGRSPAESNAPQLDRYYDLCTEIYLPSSPILFSSSFPLFPLILLPSLDNILYVSCVVKTIFNAISASHFIPAAIVLLEKSQDNVKNQGPLHFPVCHWWPKFQEKVRSLRSMQVRGEPNFLFWLNLWDQQDLITGGPPPVALGSPMTLSLRPSPTATKESLFIATAMCFMWFQNFFSFHKSS